MNPKYIAASAAMVLSLCCASFLLAADIALPSVVVREDGSAVYNWDPNTIVSGENHLITSVPGIFTGTNVAPIVGATKFYTNGYTGAGSISMNVEAGLVWNAHETLGDVISFTSAAGVPSAP